MRFVEITKRYGDNVVFDHFSLEIPHQTILSVVGPSGEGKTTLLHMAAKLLEPDSGKVVKELSEEGPVSYLFQEPRLLEKSNVFSNVELALHKAYENKKERSEIALHYLDLVGLKESLSLYPAQLSGGMRQRVAIARSFAHPSNLMLLDEPFQSLDIRLRYDLISSFETLWKEAPKTTLFVTHDPKEALLLGDSICCLGNPEKPKLLVKIDIPREARNISDATLLSYESQIVESLVND